MPYFLAASHTSSSDNTPTQYIEDDNDGGFDEHEDVKDASIQQVDFWLQSGCRRH